jgi:hypothetical protein
MKLQKQKFIPNLMEKREPGIGSVAMLYIEFIRRNEQIKF